MSVTDLDEAISALPGWVSPPSTQEQLRQGRALRTQFPRSRNAELSVFSGRAPLRILNEQNQIRDPELVPLRRERMLESPFAFFRGTAAIMAADLADGWHTGITVPSCGDAHIANFGFYASPQRTLVFDLNDFDEAAWAPWEWDVKRLVTSVVIAGAAAGHADAVVREAVVSAVEAYARALRHAVLRSPADRYFTSFDPRAGLEKRDLESQKVLRRAIKQARKHTGERALRKLTMKTASGQLVFLTQPPKMTRLAPEVEAQTRDYVTRYLRSTSADIAQLMQHYELSDVARRVVGVGSVGTRCALALMQDGDGNALVMQSKEAGPSVLEKYGRVTQPEPLRQLVEQHGEGARVVALQRMLQAVSDPFLGYLRGDDVELYVRQFHDMKGGIAIEELYVAPFVAYAQACAVTLARAHSQAPNAAIVSGYVGSGRSLGEALLAWGREYAHLSQQDFAAFHRSADQQ